MKSLPLFLFVALCPLALAVETGSPAPDFSLSDGNGKTHQLKQYRGKIVVLEWLNHDCPFVKKQYKTGEMQRLQKNATKDGVIWLSINSSKIGKQGYLTPKTALELTREKKAHPTAVLLDPSGDTGRAYNAKTTPHLFIIDPQGNLAYQGAVDNTPSAQTDEQAPPEGQYVANALSAMKSGKKPQPDSTPPYGCSVKY